MNVELFIAKRIHFNKTSDRTLSRPAVFVATLGVAIGLAVMLLSVAIVVGFKKEVREKVIGFGSHIQVTNFDTNSTYETRPVAFPDAAVDSLRGAAHIRSVSRFATKPGIIKTDENFQGIVLKGVGDDFDWNFFERNLTEGVHPVFCRDSVSNNVLISKPLAEKMRLSVGDAFVTYFIKENVRARKFVVSGIYSSGFKDFDDLFILADIRHVQKLNGWSDAQVTGLEVTIDDYEHLEEAAWNVRAVFSNRFDADGSAYYVQSIREVSPEIFNWLDLLDMNVWVILALMISVAGFNMLSGLLILILEKANTIGILKSIGARNASVRQVFLYQSVFLIGKGMFWGNVAGLSLMAVQKFTGIVALDADVYYLSVVPVGLTFAHWLLLNAGTFALSVLMMVGPSYLVAKVRPAQSIRFD